MDLVIAAVAVLVAAAVLLAAPLDPGRRLRELLPGSGRTSTSGSTRSANGTPTSAREQDRVPPAGRRAGPEEEALWAIGAVENCAHLLRVGMTPVAVMAALSRQDARLEPISRAIGLGEAPGQAIAARHAQLPPAAAEVFAGMAAVWTVSESSGAPAAEMILRYARARRDSLDAEREVRVAMAGPRTTVTVLSWLPVIGIGLGLLLGVKPLELITGVPGQLSIAGGGLLYVLGRMWMRSMLVRALA